MALRPDPRCRVSADPGHPSRADPVSGRCLKCAGRPLATALFAAGLAARLAHGPAWLAWTLFLACYAAGGWEPGLAGLRALRERTPGRGPADGGRGDRRGRDRAGA